MKRRRAKRKALRTRRRKKPVRGDTARRGTTQFDEHVKMARRLAKKLRRKVAKLTGKSRRKK